MKEHELKVKSQPPSQVAPVCHMIPRFPPLWGREPRDYIKVMLVLPVTDTMRAAVTLVWLLHACSAIPVRRPTNWLRQCRTSTNLSITALEVLPGGGWDNLRNVDTGRVMNLTYSQCQTTEDGFYLIPDEVFVIPRKETGVETNSEMLSSWLDSRSSTSHSINSDISFFSVLNGKFSTENQRMKTHQVKESSVATRVQVSLF